jgi:transcriptional regulator with XRE-family HTH domain
VLLARTGQTQDSIAAAVGVSRPAVAQWLSGTTRPNKKETREKLLALYGIPVDSWDEPARAKRAEATTPAPVSAPVSAGSSVPDGVLGKAKMLEDMAHDMLRDLRADTEAFPLEKAKVMNSIAGTLALIAKLNGDFDLGQRMFKLPVWRRIEAALATALASYPEAAAAVGRELRKVEAENSYERT